MIIQYTKDSKEKLMPSNSPIILLGMEYLGGRIASIALSEMEVSAEKLAEIETHIVETNIPMEQWESHCPESTNILGEPYRFWPICIRDELTKGLCCSNSKQAIEVAEQTIPVFDSFFQSSQSKQVIICINTYEFYGSCMGIEIGKCAINNGKEVTFALFHAGPLKAIHLTRQKNQEATIEAINKITQEEQANLYLKDLDIKYLEVTDKTIPEYFHQIERDNIESLKHILYRVIEKN